eukprot:gene4569-4290_t
MPVRARRPVPRCRWGGTWLLRRAAGPDTRVIVISPDTPTKYIDPPRGSADTPCGGDGVSLRSYLRWVRGNG